MANAISDLAQRVTAGLLKPTGVSVKPMAPVAPIAHPVYSGTKTVVTPRHLIPVKKIAPTTVQQAHPLVRVNPAKYVVTKG